MKIVKMIAVTGIAGALMMGITGCGPKYEGEATVVNKQIDKSTSTSSSSSKSKRTKTTTDYEVTVDIPDTNINQIIDVPKSQYDTIQVGQTVTIEKGKIR